MSEFKVDGDAIAEVVAYLNGHKTAPAKRMADAVLRLLNRHYQDAAALEAAREDACVALVADIRFACGDNGKRMQPELVEFIRGLAADAERWRHARRILTVEDIESSQDMFDTFGVEGDEHENRKADAAIDQARGKGGGE